MKKWLLVVFLLLIASPVFAEKKEAEKPRSDTAVSEQNKPSRPEKKDTKKKSQATWPREYSPTEEVRADSIVPFPTDI